MITKKLAFLATTALVGNAFAAAGAYAQSTASSTMDYVVITGQSGPDNVGGAIQVETVAKARTTIDQEFIDKQVPGQTILQTLNIVTPGLNFTNNDPYGSSGGNIRLHGFDGNRVALTFDGMPLNDTGNYATYTNQLLDGELIAKAQVNTGSTDVDSPTAASTGGTIAFSSRTPADEFGGFVQGALGDFAFRRYMAFVDTGVFTPWGTKAWAAYSDQSYDKFKGAGGLKKKQYNFKIYQPIGDNGDFVSVAAHYNENRNNAYFGPSLTTYNANGSIATLPSVETDPRGWKFDFNNNYAPITSTVRAGFTGDIDLDPSANSSYYGLRINPSNTGNIRGQSKFSIGDNLTFTLDPSFQYTLANGGTQNTLIYESCNGSTTSNTATNCPTLTRQLIGNLAPSATRGVDINGDGDLNDQVRVMNPSNTNTRRVGVLSSLIWEVNPDHMLRFAYTFDRGRHRQTGEFGYINPDLTYASNFGGKDGEGDKINTVDGASFLRNRDRFSIAELNQFSLEYRGWFLDRDLNVSIGVRNPNFERELNQYCFSQVGSSNVRCTSETPNATLANGNVTFTGGTTQYIAPYSKTLKFDDILPNVGVSYNFGDSQVFGSYAESTSLPRTDNLYTVFRLADGSIGNPNVQPETSQTIEIGYRYSIADVIFSSSIWSTKFQNRIVQSYDQDLGVSIDRNVGEVEQSGVDLAVGWEAADNFRLFGSASYNQSEVMDNIQTGVSTTTVGSVTTVTPIFAMTKGKQLAETPDWTWSARAEYDFASWAQLGVQVKFVGDRWVTDVNDQQVGAYAVTDIDFRVPLDDFGFEGSSIQLNVMNVFDKDYYGSIGSQTSSTVGQPGFGTPFANIGAPRTATISFRYGF
jgi:iron complex outermembrane receptor protein